MWVSRPDRALVEFVRENLSMQNRFMSAVMVALVAICVMVSGAAAQPAPDLRLRVQWATSSWQSGPDTMHLTPDPNNPNNWLFEGGTTQTAWTATWSGNVDADPAINSGIAFTNNTGVTQTFTTTLTLPTAGAIPAPSTIFGGVTVSVSGAGVPQTISTPAGDFMYRALASNVFVGPPADLIGSPFSLATGPLGLPVSFGPVNFGPANGPGLAAVDSIGIRHTFTLTPGATATINGAFVLVVPEPATLALLPLAGLVFARRNRRS
jgi:hypothetical protein